MEHRCKEQGNCKEDLLVALPSFEAMDRNADGVIDRDEFKAAKRREC